MGVTALICQMLNEDEGEQCQALGGLVDLRGSQFRHEVIKATRVADQLEAQCLEQRAVLVLAVGELSVQLRIAAADVIALEQLAKDRRELGHFG